MPATIRVAASVDRGHGPRLPGCWVRTLQFIQKEMSFAGKVNPSDDDIQQCADALFEFTPGTIVRGSEVVDTIATREFTTGLDRGLMRRVVHSHGKPAIHLSHRHARHVG